MARSNPEYESEAESQTSTESEPQSLSAASDHTPEPIRPFKSQLTHLIFFTLTTLNVYHPDHQGRVYIVRPAQIWNSLNRHRDCISSYLPPIPTPTPFLYLTSPHLISS